MRSKIYGRDVAAVLEDGERLLAMGLVHAHLSGDTSELASEGGEPGRPAGLVDGVDWTGVQYSQDRVNRFLGGSSGSGFAGSWGDRTWQALKARAVKGTTEWAVTDRRLLLLDSDHGNPATFTVLFQVPRAAIHAVRRRSKILLQWGRVEVGFADGSRIAMVLALLDVGAATNFVRALRAR
ncbi:hypothetical protein [Actinoplanes sp. NPDC048796]|uniref:hypothetical protein n=1 Tax=Actinoplanes sp. NPDC048796 TaxID=3155640 RepID=UPI0033D27597